MKKIRAYKIIWLLLAFAASSGCNFGNQKKLNRRVTLWRKDKIPYGTYYAYENMPYIFPSANISINKTSPAKYEEFELPGYTTADSVIKPKKAYIIISPQVVPNESEINAMLNFVGEGNYIFISAFHIGDSLLNNLKVKTQVANGMFFPKDTLRVKVSNPVTYDALAFEYPGDSYSSYISSLDSQYTTILGTDESGRADFVKFNYKSGGAIFLHFAPMAFTNFFLLHKNNKTYFDNVFSYLPQSITEIKWDDYFRYPRNSNFSALNYILSNPSFRWAFWLLMLLFFFIYLFESKRKQRMIPAVSTLRNSSLDFVKTIGHLYYQKKDNLNLANKMSVHFLSYVRTKYNLPTSFLNNEFVDKLSYKSGYDKNLVKDIVDHIKVTQQQQSLTDEGLLDLNEKIEAFYKLS